MKPVWPTYSPTTAADGGGEDSKPTLSGHSSGWAADGWTPPDSHLLGGGDNVDNLFASIAVMLMLTVVPNMIFNAWRIRREQKELGH